MPDGFAQVTAFDLRAVYSDNLIAAANAGTRGGRAGDRRNNRDGTIDLVDLDADARVGAGCACPDIAILASVQELRVWVEVADHAADRAFQQLGIIDRFNIILFDEFEHLRQQAGLLVRHCVPVWRVAAYQSTAERQAEAQHKADYNNQYRPGFQ